MFGFCLVAALLLCCSSAPHARPKTQHVHVQSVNDITRFADKLVQLQSRLQLSRDDNDPCAFNAAGNDTYAGIKMLDASGKPGSNLMSLTNSGMWQWLGDYDECASIGHEVAQYCLFEAEYGAVLPEFTIPLANKTFHIPALRWGLCVPRQCNASALTTKVIETIREVIVFNSSLATAICQPSQIEFSSFAIVVIVLCCIIGLLVVVATVVDYLHDCVKRIFYGSNRLEGSGSSEKLINSYEEESVLLAADKNSTQKSSLFLELLLCFSLVQNVPKLLDTTRSAKNIACLHGIRTLSMMWVILGHCYAFYLILFRNIANTEEAVKLPLHFSFQAISNALFSVDSFFFLSGLLVMYLSLQQLDLTAGSFPWIKFYVHRFLRLTPTYAMALLIYWQLMPYFVDGPLWMGMYNNKFCDDSWWTNLLYINNFTPKFNNMCMGWSWFLAADTQMYVISPIVIIPAFFYSILGLIPLAVLLAVVLGVIATIVTVKEFPANVLSMYRSTSGGSTEEYQNMVYGKFYTRAAPYLVGMAVGYYLARRDRLKLKSFQLWTVGGWILAAGLGVTIVYGLYDYNHGHHYSQAASSLYLTFSSCLWGVCLAWVVYACTSGNGGIVDNILSWTGWFPLSRLTYSAYLLHPVVLIVYQGSLRQLTFMDNLHMAYYFVAVTGLSYASAAVLSLCVEFPVAAVEKIVLKRLRV